MSSPYLIADLKRDEGCRLHAYPDPLSGGEPYTIGWGCTGAEIGPDTEWTQAQADDELAKRVGDLIPALRAKLPWFTALSDLRQDCLVNMAFNLGVAGLLAFHHTLSAVQAGDWQAAHDGMLNSAWAHQVGARATRLATQMLTDVHA